MNDCCCAFFIVVHIQSLVSVVYCDNNGKETSKFLRLTGFSQ